MLFTFLVLFFRYLSLFVVRLSSAEDEFKMKYADFIQATSTIEHTRRTCEKTIFELRERVQSEYDMVRDIFV